MIWKIHIDDVYKNNKCIIIFILEMLCAKRNKKIEDIDKLILVRSEKDLWRDIEVGRIMNQHNIPHEFWYTDYLE